MQFRTRHWFHTLGAGLLAAVLIALLPALGTVGSAQRAGAPACRAGRHAGATALPIHGPAKRRAHLRGRRHPRRHHDLLRRRGVRRRLEDHRRRQDVRADLRRPAGAGHRRARRRRRPTRTSSGRARAKRGPSATPTCRATACTSRPTRGETWTNMGLKETGRIGRDHRPPDEPQHRLRVRARPRDRPAGRARRLPHDRRRRDVAARAVRRPEHRLLRPRDGRRTTRTC